MKWLFGLVLVILVVAGALYGVGYFLLPNELAVTRTATIERPRATVFAMSNDLRIVKEWSPYYALDPDAEYAFSGEGPGEGQSMRWTSDVKQVGSGRMSIVRSDENEQIGSILELGDRATLNSRMSLAPAQEGTHVTWLVSATCAQGWINVPCRYMNLVMRGMIQRDLDAGLGRLKTLTEQLPNVNFEGLQSEIIEDVEPVAYVFSVASTSTEDPAEVDRAEALCINAVREFMTQYSLTASGPLVRVTTDWDAAQSRMGFRVGYPFAGPRPLTVAGVQIGETPSGRALRVVHTGPRTQMRSTYAKAYAYLQAHRIPMREGGLPWEVVLSPGSGDDGAAQTEIFIPLQ